jgi:uncharacterized membrane protein YeaQ/YmgE (transglycosylase-associated protein family)
MNMQPGSLVAWVVVGLIAGFIASLLVGGGGGILAWLIAGLIGSIVGGFIAQQTRLQLNLGNVFAEQIVISVIGAIVVIVVARLIVG